MYDIIYSFISENIFNSATLDTYTYNISGVNTTLNQWLTHTACISIMIIAIILCVLLIRWVFRLVSSAFLLR